MSLGFGRAVPTGPCVRIRLDNGENVVCAVTQQIMLRDGDYVAAGALTAGTSLMPLYTRLDKDGYVLVQQNYSGRWQKAHWIAARCGLLGEIPRFDGQRTVIHHKNFDPADNTPQNLEFMGANDHAAFHRSIVERNEHWQSPDFESRRVAALAAKAETPGGHAYFAARGTKNIKAYMEQRPEHFRAAVAGNGKRGAPVLAKYNTSSKGKQKSRELANAKYPCEVCGEYVKSYIGLYNHRRWRHGFNHKVTALESTTPPPELFCVAEQTCGNIALSAGIFASACLPRP
jgi:tRNA-splicing ligase RtcB